MTLGERGKRHGRPPKPKECDRLFAECVNTGDVDGVLALYEDRAC